MKQMTTVSSIREEAAQARQRAHVMRERWEESWLAQQRRTTAVISHTGDQSVSVTDNPIRQSLHESESLAGAAVTAYESSHEATAQPCGADGQCVVKRAVPASVSSHRSSTTTHGVPASMHVEPQTRRYLPAAKAAHAPGAPQERLPSSAFWRREGSIEGAMRLRDPERSAASILAQLRHWLRAAGAHLRKVFINGRVAWQADSPAGSIRSGEPPPASNRHTYI